MNITKQQIDELNAVVNVQIEEKDYQDSIEKRIIEIRRTANLKGFRPGQVPKDLVRKMYGKSVLAEEVNKVLSHSLEHYLEDNKIEILGRPIMKPDMSPIDWDSEKNFSFDFEIALKPDFDIALTENDKFVKYDIAVADKDIDDTIKIICERSGNFVDTDKCEESDVIRGDFAEVDENDNLIEGGIKNKTSVSPKYYEEGLKQKFLGLKKGDILFIMPAEMAAHVTEFSTMFGIKKEEVANIKNNIRFTIDNIQRIQPAAVNQELFDKMFGKDAVKSEEEFRSRLKEEKGKEYLSYAENKIKNDIFSHLIEKTNINLPDDFLKKFILTQDNVNPEEVEKSFPEYLKKLRWELIKSKIAKDNEIKIEEAEMDEFAKENIKNQFRYSYGISDDGLSDEMMTTYLNNLKKNYPQELERMVETLYEKKVYDALFSKLNLEEKQISWDDFVNLDSKKLK